MLRLDAQPQFRCRARSPFLRSFVRRYLTFVLSAPITDTQLLLLPLVFHLRVADFNFPLHDDWLLLLEVGAMLDLEFRRPYLLLYIGDLFN